jgi:NAD(P)H dehydrogenase (quinone)
VVADLRRIAPTANVIGLVRNITTAKDLADSGIELRRADYDDKASVSAALAGADKLLLISSSEIGQRRVAQHRNVIDAARSAGLRLLVYTSLLHADTSPMALAEGHRQTETLIRTSGIPFVLLRNGWYTENYTVSAPTAAQTGTVLGAARDGRISSASRADFAAAAAVTLARHDSKAGAVYELAGDAAYSLAELAAEIARQSGKPVAYKDLTEVEYKLALQSSGLSQAFAAVYAESDAKAALGCLFDDGRALSRLIGRPTTSMASSVAAALAAWTPPAAKQADVR